MGATILSRPEFELATNKRGQKQVKQGRPVAVDLVVWGEGEQEVLSTADQHKIPIVSPGWVQTCHETSKKPRYEDFKLSEVERLRCFDNMGTTAKKLRRRSESPDGEESRSDFPKKQVKKVSI